MDTIKSFAAPPASAAWQHQDARAGFEVVFFQALEDGYRMQGSTTAVEDGEPWIVSYTITVDSAWRTRSAHLTSHVNSGPGSLVLEGDGSGSWKINGEPAPDLEGCLDVDLESSVMTNALPVHRLDLPVDGQASAPALFVRVSDLSVEWLNQHYLRVPDEDGLQNYDYAAPSFEVECRLRYDVSGFVVNYPGLAVSVPVAN